MDSKTSENLNEITLTMDDYNFLMVKLERKEQDILKIRCRLDQVLDIVDRQTIQLQYYEKTDLDNFSK